MFLLFASDFTDKSDMFGFDFTVSVAADITDATTNVTLSDNDGDSCYEIGTADQLYAFANIVNGGNTSVNAELTADIVVNTGNVAGCNGTKASGWKEWTPIGNYSNRYTGTFDGNNKTISGLYFNNSNQSNVGLFGCSYGAIKNVGVVNSYFMGYYYVGGVCGYSYNGTIENCYNTGTVSGTGYYVGGVCGLNAGTITNCYNTGSVNGRLGNVGGVCGFNYNGGTITNCYYDNTVYTGEGVGNSSDTGTTVTNVLGKSTEQFANGEVCTLLNNGNSNGVWKQNGGLPAFTGKTADVVGSATGVGTVEDIINFEVVTVTLPTISDNTLDFIMDPQGLINGTSGARYGATFSEGTLFFANAPAVQGGDVTYSSTSDNLKFESKSAVKVDMKLTAIIENSGDLKFSSTDDFSGDDAKANVYLAIVNAAQTSEKHAITDEGVEIDKTLDELNSSNFEVTYDETDGYKYELTTEAQAADGNICTFNITGKSNPNANWKGLADAQPTIEFVWSMTKHVDANA